MSEVQTAPGPADRCHRIAPHRDQRFSEILTELGKHAPFTLLGTATGIVFLLAVVKAALPRSIAESVFWTLHPLHVLLSALVTAAMYRLHGGNGWWQILLVGYLGSVGLATLSDSLIPFAGEWLLDLPRRDVHLGFVEKWWLVHPLAILGIGIAVVWPHTHVSHAAHVLLSTSASLFHLIMALGESLSWTLLPPMATFLFLAVWVPCCTSDIVFPLLFRPRRPVQPVETSHAGPEVPEVIKPGHQ